MDEKRPVTARDIQTVVEKRRQTAPAAKTSRPSPTARLDSAREVLKELEEALAEDRDPAGLLRKLRKLLDG